MGRWQVEIIKPPEPTVDKYPNKESIGLTLDVYSEELTMLQARLAGLT